MIRGALIVISLALNTLLWGTPILVVGLLKLITPTRFLRRAIRVALAEMGDRWAGGNERIFDRFLSTKWDIEVDGPLLRDGHYLIISNHVSWSDIFVLFRVFHRRVAFLRFFIKHELIWFPIVGQACWVMDFPFMRRYSAEFLERHPEMRGRDLETTRRSIRRYRRIPLAILNFVEGTRFTQEKHDDQESPYRHLLRPRVGGVAFVLASLGEQLDGVVDVTIAYPRPDITVWELLTNRVERIVVRARCLEVPAEFLNNDITEPGPARDDFKQWIESLWTAKDKLLADIHTVVH